MTAQTTQLATLATDGSLDALEERWLEAFGATPAESGALATLLTDAARAIEAVLARGQPEMAAGLLEVVAEDVEGSAPGEPRLAFARALARARPSDPSVRRRLRDAYRKAYKGRRALDRLLELSGLYQEDKPPADVIERVERYLPFEEGVVVRHTSWGTGKIQKVDRFTAELVIDFIGRPRHRMTPDGAAEGLEILPADDFDARGHADPEGLKEQVAKAPLDVLKMVLRTLGGHASADAVRDKLRGEYIAAGKWSGWWTRAKKAALQDPFIEVAEGRPVKLTLREQAKSFLDEAIEQLRNARSFAEKWDIAKRFLRHGEEGLDAVWAELAGDMGRPLGTFEYEDRPALVEAAIERGLPLEPFVDLTEVETLLLELSSPTMQQALAEAIAAVNEDWPAVFARCLTADGCRIRPWIREQLLEHDPVRLADWDDVLITDPARDPDGFLRLAERVLGGRWVASAATNDPFEILIYLMQLVRTFEHGRSTSRDFIKPAVKLLTAKKCALVEQLVEHAALNRVKRAARLMHGSSSLEPVLVAVRPALLDRLPDLDLDGDVPFWEQHELLVSAASLERQRKELTRMMDIEMAEVEKQIGHAASFGDLSENSEWTAAIERRNQLVERIEQLKHQLNVAEVLERQPIEDTRVCPGTRVLLQRLDRTEPPRELTFLGPWDVNVDDGVLSYLSPLAAGLLGHAVGERVWVQLPDGRGEYEIQSIEKAL